MSKVCRKIIMWQKGLNENPISEIIRVLKYKANWNNKKNNTNK